MNSLPDREPLSPARRFGSAVRLGMLLLPWLAVLGFHYHGNGLDATGFIQYDQPYYVANGRAAFERGNGFLYPNPSDASADAPDIYFHWMPWLLGLSVVRLGLSPGTAYSLLNVVLLPVFGFLTWQLVARRSTAQQGALMMLALWGGGVLSLIGLLKGLAAGVAPDPAVFEFDPIDGYWFLNWGRNTIYACEITYHCLVAATWLAVLNGRREFALLFAGMLGLTHPWSGLETLLVLNAWYLLEAVREKNGRSMVTLGAAVTLLTLLLGYYKVWLPQFPAHAALQENWSLNWRVESSTMLYAWGPVALVAAIHLLQQGKAIDRDEQFLLVAAAVAFALSTHDRILPKSVQPIHFTRGYIWMPLFLIALPRIQQVVERIRDIPGVRRHVVMSGLLIIVCFDNIAFTVAHSRRQYRGQEGFFLNADDRRVLDALSYAARDSVVFCESLELSYLMPTWVPVRPWLCHKFNTPDYIDRQKELRHVLADNRIQPDDLPPEIDVLVLRSDRDSTALAHSPTWAKFDRPSRGAWQIWRRNPHPEARARRTTISQRG